MNLRTISSNVLQWFRPTEPIETTRRIANRLYQNRLLTQQDGDADGDWQQAERIRKNEVRRLLFWVNQPCIWTEKRVVEPLAHLVDRADFFRITVKLSPTLEAIGVVAIPVVLFFATQRYQEDLQQRELEKIQQETVANYLYQLSAILLDVKGDLRDPQNEKLRTLTTATTLTLLRDPNLNGERKSQIMRFLLRMDLIEKDMDYGPKRPDEVVTTLNFSYANLSGADLSNTLLSRMFLSGANLNDANLREADLGAANLSGARLRSANLSGAALWAANLSGAQLRSANLSGADLWAANLSEANLINANLSGAALSDANLSGAQLQSANLSGVFLSDVKLKDADLCRTQLPKRSQLDPDRDC